MGTKRTKVQKRTGGVTKKRRLELEEEKQEIEISQSKWPKSSLNFKCWDDDVAFTLVRDTLKKRGWRDRGRLCNPADVNLLKEIAKGKSGRLYSRCLW